MCILNGHYFLANKLTESLPILPILIRNGACNHSTMLTVKQLSSKIWDGGCSFCSPAAVNIKFLLLPISALALTSKS